MDNDLTLRKMQELLKSNPRDVGAFKTLEEQYFLSNNWTELAKLYEFRAEATSKASPSESAQLYHKCGETMEKRLSNPEKALELYHKAFQASPSTPKYGDSLYQYYCSCEEWEKALEILTGQLKRTQQKDHVIQILHRMSQLYQHQLSQVEEAKKCLEQILQHDNNDQKALTQLEEMYYNDQQWADLIPLYNLHLSRNIPPETKLQLVDRCAVICRDRLNDYAKAVEYFRKLFEMNPQSMYPLSSMEEIYLKCQQWEYAVEVMNKQVQLTQDNSSKAQVLTKMGNVLHEKLSNHTKAAQCFEQAFSFFGDGALLDSLETVYSEVSQWQSLATVYERKAQLSQDTQSRVELFCKIGDIAITHLQDSAMAIKWYRAAWKIEKKIEFIHQVQELYKKDGNLEELILAYSEETDYLEKDDDKIAVHEKIIQVYREQRDYLKTAKAYENLLTNFPSYSKGINEFIDLCRNEGDFQQLVQAINKRIALAPKSVDTITDYLEVAYVLKEQMGKPEQAIGFYQKALEIDRTNIDIWRKLRDYYDETKNYPLLISSLKNINQLDATYREEGFLKIALIYHEKLEQADEAIQHYEFTLQENINNILAVSALVQLYKAKQAWDKYITMLTRQIELTVEPESAIALRFQLCEIFKQLNKASEEKLQLYAILRTQYDNKKAIARLREVHQQREEWEKLIEILQREAQLGCPTEKLFEYFKAIAQIYQHKLDNPEQAIFYFERSSSLIPSNTEVLEALTSLYQKQKLYPNLVRVLRTRAHLTDELAGQKALLFQAGVICEEKIQNKEEAIQAYEHIISLDFRHLDSLQRLENLYQEMANHAALVQVYRHRVETLKSNEDKVALLRKCGEITLDKLSDQAESAVFYEKVLRLEDNLKAMDQLIDLYTQLADSKKLQIIYTKKLPHLTAKEERVQLQNTMAELYLDQNLPENAIEVSLQIIQEDPQHKETIQRLKDLLPEVQKWQALTEVLELDLKLTESLEDQRSIFKQIASTCEDKLFQFSRAIETYNRAYKLDPRAETLESLRKLYYKEQNYEKIIWTIDEQVPLVDSKKQESLLLEKATNLQHHLKQNEQSIAALEEVIKINAENREAYDSLSAIYNEAGEYNKVIEVYERELSVAPPDRYKLNLLKCAQIWQDNLGEIEKAKDALLRILDEDAGFESAQKHLEDIHKNLGEWEKLLELYTKILPVAEDEKKSQVYHKMGVIWHFHIPDFKKATEHYHKSLSINQNNAEALKNVQEIYLEEKNYSALLQAYQSELGLPEVDRERQIFLHNQSAVIQSEQLDLPADAIESYKKVIDIVLDPTNLFAIRGLEKLYEKEKMFKDQQTVLFRELELQKEKHRLTAVHLELAKLMEEKLEDTDVAIEHFFEAHLARPSSLPIIYRLKKLLHEKERWDEYVDVVEKEINLSTGKFDKIELHREILEIYQNNLQNYGKAIEHGEAILSLDELNLYGIHKLQELYQIAEENEKLVGVYLKEVATLPDDENQRKETLYLESGRLYQNSLDQVDHAVDCFEKVLAINPSNKEAFSPLIKLLTNQQKWDRLIDVYKLVAQVSRHQQERESLYLKIGELWEKLENLENAMLAYQIVYSMNSKNLNAVSDIRNIFEKQEQWGNAVAFLSVEAYLVEEKKQPGVFLKMGSIWEEKLEMPQQALSCYLRVLAHGFHRQTAEKAMQIQKMVQDYEGLTEILEKDLKVTENPEEKVAKLLQLAEIKWKHLRSKEDAVEIYKKALQIEKSNITALDSLETLLTDLAKWQEVVPILLAKKDVVVEPEQLESIYRKIGDTYENHLHSGNQAIQYYEKFLELKPRDLEVIRILQALYYRWGYYKKLIQLYIKETQIVKEEDRIVHLYREMGKIWESYLFEPSKSIQAYEKLLEINAEDIFANRALEPLYHKQQDWNKLTNVYKILVKDARKHCETAEEIRIYMALGNLYRDELQNTQAASQAFQHVISIEPAHKEALASIENLYKGQGQAKEMAELMEKKMEHCDNDEDRLELHLRLGKLLSSELDEPERAIEHFKKALEIEKDHLEALQALDALYLKKEMWQELSEICKLELELTKENKVKAELAYRLGLMARDKFQDQDTARDRLLEAVEYEPTMRKALKGLTGLAILSEDWAQAVKYISKEIQYINDPQEKVGVLTDLGALYQSKLRLIQKAKDAFQKALEIDPTSFLALESIADIHFSQGDWQEAENLLQRLSLQLGKDEKNKLSEICYKWGYCAEQTGKKDDAIIRYNSSLEAKGDRFETLSALGKLYYERAQWGFDKAQWQEALKVYQQIMEHPQLEEKLEVTRRLATIQVSLGLVEEATVNCEKVLKEEPNNCEMIQVLAKLHIQKEEDEKALELLDSILQKDTASFQEQRAALLQIAEIQKKRGEHQLAIDAYRKAFSMGVEDHEILRNLGESYIAVANWKEAREWLHKHFQCLDYDEERVENRCLMAHIMSEMGLFEKAIGFYKEALRYDCHHTPAIEGMAKILTDKERWDELAESYKSFLQNLSSEKKDVGIPIHLALGYLYFEKLNDRKAAIGEFDQVLAMQPEHTATHAALAKIKGEMPEFLEDAVASHLLLIKEEPLRFDSYRELSSIFQQQEKTGRAFWAGSSADVLGSLSPKEKKFIESFKVPSVTTVTPKHELQLSPKSKKHFEVMAMTCDHMSKVYPSDMENKYGLRKKDRVVSGEGQLASLWNLVEDLKYFYGIDTIDLYIYPRKKYRVYLENTQPYSLVVSWTLTETLSEQELRFLLAKYLFYVAHKQVMTAILSEEDLKQHFHVLSEMFLRGATREIFLRSSASLDNPEDDTLAKKIRGGLTRKVKKSLEEDMEIWHKVRQQETHVYRKELDQISNHYAMLYSGSVNASVHMLYRLHILETTGKFITSENIPQQELYKLEAARDLFQYSVSSSMENLCKQIEMF